MNWIYYKFLCGPIFSFPFRGKLGVKLLGGKERLLLHNVEEVKEFSSDGNDLWLLKELMANTQFQAVLWTMLPNKEIEEGY